MACKKKGRACLMKLSQIADKMGWKVIFKHNHDGVVYDVVLIDKSQNAHAFKARGVALVFLVGEARKLGFSA